MTLARVTTWADGQTLTAAALNGEFDNIINNSGSLFTAAQGVSQVNGLRVDLVTGANVFTVSARSYQMRSTSQACSVSATSSFDINTQTAGPIAGGRDQAGAFASTTVHFYAISTGVNSTAPAGICSTNPPSIGPTLPTNYTGWTYLASFVYSTLSSGVTTPYQGAGVVRGNRLYGGGSLGNLTSTAIGVTATGSGTSLLIPSGDVVTHLLYEGSWGLLPGSTGGTAQATFSVYSATSGVASPLVSIPWTIGSTLTAYTGARHVIPTGLVALPTWSAVPKLAYNIFIISGTSGTVSGDVIGLVLANGDVG